MEVLTIESLAFQRMESMFKESQAIIKVQADALLRLKIGLLSSKEVSELTGYCERTIKSRKDEIGYSTIGKDLKFKPSDVEAWINKNYRSPKK